MRRLQTLGRFVGVVASVGNIVLILMLWFFNPYGKFAVPTETYFIFSLMVVLSLLAVYACVKMVPLVMYGVFCGSFFPVGFYLLGTPGIFRWIGVFNLFYLASAVLMSAGKERSPAEAPSGEPSTSSAGKHEKPNVWWLAAAGSLMGLAACAYEAYVFCSPHLVHYLWETAALGAYILFFGAALAGSLCRRREVVLTAGVLALGLTVLLFVIGLVAAFAPPDYVPFLPGSILILLAGLVRSGGAKTTSRFPPPRR
ncbi:MAG: hypothetical protein AB1330_04280 [Bacillota bacterium]